MSLRSDLSVCPAEVKALDPLSFDEIRKRARRPWGGALKSYKCFCCGSGTKLQNHHIEPREDGGSDSPRNKVTLCSKCHDAVEGERWSVILARREAIRDERRQGRRGEETAPASLDEYFQMRRTPGKESPVGLLMQRILEESPDLSFEDARNLAQTQLVKASGRRAYRVTTPAQDRESLERFSRRVNPTPETAIAAD